MDQLVLLLQLVIYSTTTKVVYFPTNKLIRVQRQSTMVWLQWAMELLLKVRSTLLCAILGLTNGAKRDTYGLH